jgi:hypothetical protein
VDVTSSDSEGGGPAGVQKKKKDGRCRGVFKGVKEISEILLLDKVNTKLISFYLVLGKVGLT